MESKKEFEAENQGIKECEHMAVNLSESSTIIGQVGLGEGAYIAQGAVLRSKKASLTMGNQSFVLENSVLISSQSHPTSVGSKTVFGHKCIIMGAEIGDLCEIGNNVIIMPGAKLGNRCILGEGTLIPENTNIPDGSVVLGRPGRVIRKLNDADMKMIEKMRSGDVSLSAYIENMVTNNHEEGETMGKLYEYKGKYPEVAESAFLFDSAEVTGDVTIGENTIIGAGVKIIGDSHGPIRIGNNVQILENTVLHLLPDNVLILEDNVVIGPGAMIHGCTIGEGTIIEPGAIVCDNSAIGKGCIVKAGSLVKQRSSFEDNCILEGFPARQVDTVKDKNEIPSWALNIEDLRK